jgi:hypothetical protein
MNNAQIAQMFREDERRWLPGFDLRLPQRRR